MPMQKAEIIRAIFAAYLSNDRKAVEDALTDDFRFTSPYDDEIDKATYFARGWRNSDWIERHQLERIFAEGDEAFVTYQCLATRSNASTSISAPPIRTAPSSGKTKTEPEPSACRSRCISTPWRRTATRC